MEGLLIEVGGYYSRGLVLRNCSNEPDSEKAYDFIVIILISTNIRVFLQLKPEELRPLPEKMVFLSRQDSECTKNK